MRLIIASIAILALAAPALAQTPAAAPAPDCSKPAPLTGELAGWSTKAPITSATNEATLSAAALTIGKSHEAALLKTPQVAYVLQPEKPGGSVSNGGLFSFTAETAGTYRVALSTAAWIDLIEDGKSLIPTTFGHGPDCSGIRKIVDFPLKAGKHTLQISANADPKMVLMVTKKP
ncbi:MAG TPA: hypothetical protein VGO52_25120 [Hyphomonadaceae bacterium]|jgi:hypothetical protein|nr:hypothetical protein [Hyphomonadaceae bacterium]